jgi:hypothetical protein
LEYSSFYRSISPPFRHQLFVDFNASLIRHVGSRCR